jgi:hypothetical protein
MFLPPSSVDFLPRAAEVRGGRVLAPTWWFWKVCVGPGVRDAGMARVRSLGDDMLNDAHA